MSARGLWRAIEGGAGLSFSRRAWVVVCLGLGAAAALVAGGIADHVLRGDARLVVITLPAGHGLGGAVDVAVAGGHAWVLSADNNGLGSVTELDAGDGRWIRTVGGSRYGLQYPSGITVDGPDIWVTSDPQTGDGQAPAPGDGTVTELSAGNGGWVRTLAGPGYQFDFPGVIAAAGSHIWVASEYGGAGGNGSLTELNASTGSLVQTLSGPGIDDPVALAVRGGLMWVVNDLADGGGTVTELNASTGRTNWTAAGSRYGFTDPSSLAVDGGKLWVTNLYAGGNGGSVTEISASTGRWIQTLSGGCFGFDSPAGIAVAGPHIWVANSYIDANGGSLTEFSASTGRWIRTLSGDSWIQNLLNIRCTHGLSTDGYPFSNPALITAVGSHIWVFDGPVMILANR